MDHHRPPAFDPDTITLEIAEGSPTETYVGAPLPTATDPDGTDDETTYELADDDDIAYFELLPPYDHDNDDGYPNATAAAGPGEAHRRNSSNASYRR